MNAYVKGGLSAAFLILGLMGLWWVYSPHLAVNKKPEQYAVIARMEKDGAPDFALPLINVSSDPVPHPQGGQIFRLSSLKGKVTIVNFWASWCNPCVDEFPSLKKLIEKFDGKVELVAVSADDDLNDIQAFLRAFALSGAAAAGGGPAGAHIHVVWDKGRVIADAWGVGKIPESFLLSKAGKLVRKVIGIENWATVGALGYFQELTEKTN